MSGNYMKGSRVVVVPKTAGAPAWAYKEPRGVIVSMRHGRVIVRLDDGAVRETYAENIVPVKSYRSPKERAFKPALRPHKKLIDGPLGRSSVRGWSCVTERELAANIEALCKYLGVRYYHTWTSRNSVAGWPDYCFITADHRFLVRELKTDKGKLTAAQGAWLSALRAAGVDVAVWRPSDWPDRIKAELLPVRQLEGCS